MQPGFSCSGTFYLM